MSIFYMLILRKTWRHRCEKYRKKLPITLLKYSPSLFSAFLLVTSAQLPMKQPVIKIIRSTIGELKIQLKMHNGAIDTL